MTDLNEAPVLVLWGTWDFVTQHARHEQIGDVLKAAGNRDVTLEIVPGIDHAYAKAKDHAESFENYRKGTFVENTAAREKVVAWLKEHAEKPRMSLALRRAAGLTLRPKPIGSLHAPYLVARVRIVGAVGCG